MPLCRPLVLLVLLAQALLAAKAQSCTSPDGRGGYDCWNCDKERGMPCSDGREGWMTGRRGAHLPTCKAKLYEYSCCREVPSGPGNSCPARCSAAPKCAPAGRVSYSTAVRDCAATGARLCTTRDLQSGILGVRSVCVDDPATARTAPNSNMAWTEPSPSWFGSGQSACSAGQKLVCASASLELPEIPVDAIHYSRPPSAAWYAYFDWSGVQAQHSCVCADEAAAVAITRCCGATTDGRTTDRAGSIAGVGVEWQCDGEQHGRVADDDDDRSSMAWIISPIVNGLFWCLFIPISLCMCKHFRNLSFAKPPFNGAPVKSFRTQAFAPQAGTLAAAPPGQVQGTLVPAAAAAAQQIVQLQCPPGVEAGSVIQAQAYGQTIQVAVPQVLIRGWSWSGFS
eukprot:COSAG01_NODE_2341_length_7870_cov_22.046712_3_plen_396_part_00